MLSKSRMYLSSYVLTQDGLFFISYLYLLIPVMIFAWGWLKPLYSLILLGLGGVSLWPFRKLKFDDFFVFVRPEIFLIALFWVMFSGIGGMGFQNGDYHKHNAVLKDLLSYNWPVSYEIDGEVKSLIYYIAWYLPAVFIGQISGWKLTNGLLFLWSLLGVFLVLLWFARLTKDRWFFSSLLFIILSGADIIGFILVNRQLPFLGQHIEWWTFFNFQYSSNTSLLYWVPQQSLSGWLIISIILYESVFLKSFIFSPILLVFSLFSNPIQTIGLLPFVAMSFIENVIKSRQYQQLFNSITCLVTPVILFIFVTYFASKSLEGGGIPKGFAWQTFLWQSGDKIRKIPIDSFQLIFLFMGLYLLFLILEVAFPFTIFVNHKTERFSSFLPYVKVALLCLCLFPLYRIGQFNDWVMRASIPSLYILWIYFVERLLIYFKDFTLSRKVFTIIVLIIISVTPLMEFSRSVSRYTFYPPPYHKMITIPQLKPTVLAQQYLGTSDSFFFKYLAKPLKPGKRPPKLSRK